jgi:osmotically-inducible protein OsmY
LVTANESRGLGGAVSDAEIRIMITEHWFTEDPGLIKDLGLMIYDQRVLITGNVDDEETRATAIRLATGARGVQEVIDEVRVGQPRGLAAATTDQLITKKLQAQMLFDSEIKTTNYHRRTYDGTVYLIGVARDVAEHDRIMAMAHNISGVREVVSHITLPGATQTASNSQPGGLSGNDYNNGSVVFSQQRPPAVQAGGEIGDVTTSRLPDINLDGQNDRQYDGRQAYAVVEDGEPIPLNGTNGNRVGDPIALGDPIPLEHLRPTDAVENAAIGELTNPLDAEIALRINELWFTEASEVYPRLGLMVRDARVVITGVVPDAALRGTPYRLAWEVPGVREVYNELRVGADPTREQVARDRLAESQMISALQANPSLDPYRYGVRASSGYLYLIGTALSQNELDAVTAAAQTVDGADLVVNHMAVRDIGNSSSGNSSAGTN